MGGRGVWGVFFLILMDFVWLVWDFVVFWGGDLDFFCGFGCGLFYGFC